MLLYRVEKRVMKLRTFAVLAGLLGILATSAAQDFVPGEVLVRFRDGAAAQAIAAAKCSELGQVSGLGISRIKVRSDWSVNDAIQYFKSRSDVIFAEPRGIMYAQWTPNDPYLGEQYGWAQIKAYQAWDLFRGSPATIVAVCDSGIQITHPDLAAKLTPGYDFVNNDNNPDDDNGHGTHCAGTVGAITNNGIGVAGTAPNVRIMPVKVLSAGGSGAWDMVANGIKYAADNGAKVISLSLGSFGAADTVRTAIQYAIAKDVIVICAAGNHGTTQLFYPAAYPEVVAVAATNSSDTRAGFSAYGNWVDVAAPGENIKSTFPGDSYGLSSGTSMACPHVAGYAGLLRGANPGNNAAQTRAALEAGVDYVGNWVAKGRINLLKGVTATLATPVSYAPTAVSVFEGALVSGGLTQITNSDNNRMQVNSIAIARVGHAASINTTFKIPTPAKFRNGSVRIESVGVAGVAGSLFLWNYSTSTWVFQSTWAMASTETVGTVNLPTTLTNYLDASGNLKMIVRAVNPTNTVRTGTPFRYQVDQVQLNGRMLN